MPDFVPHDEPSEANVALALADFNHAQPAIALKSREFDRSHVLDALLAKLSFKLVLTNHLFSQRRFYQTAVLNESERGSFRYVRTRGKRHATQSSRYSQATIVITRTTPSVTDW